MTALLPLALLFELLALITRIQPLSVISGALLGLFFVWHWRSLMPYPRRLGIVTAALLGYWLLSGEASWQQGARILSSAAYYAAFIGALGLMHCLVKRLHQLSELHRLLLAGPRAWLYPGYLLSTFAISSVLSFGMLNLICGSLENHLERRPYNDTQRHSTTRRPPWDNGYRLARIRAGAPARADQRCGGDPDPRTSRPQLEHAASLRAAWRAAPAAVRMAS